MGCVILGVGGTSRKQVNKTNFAVPRRGAGVVLDPVRSLCQNSGPMPVWSFAPGLPPFRRPLQFHGSKSVFVAPGRFRTDFCFFCSGLFPEKTASEYLCYFSKAPGHRFWADFLSISLLNPIFVDRASVCGARTPNSVDRASV